MKAQRDIGIILRRIEYGEADRIVTFLMREHGKIRAIAKGVRKAKSKLAGGLELFSVSELHFIKGRGDIDTITSTRLQVHYGDIVKDFERTNQAYALLKIIDRTVEDHTGQEYFVVLHESLAALNDPRIDGLITELSFSMRILQGMGGVPDFSTDAQGNRLDPESTYEFEYEAAVFRASPGGSFNKNHLKVLKLLAHNSPQAMVAVQGVQEYCRDLAPIVRWLRDQHL